MQRRNISTGTTWEPKFGYSRAVRTGDHVVVSGTTATDDQGDIVGAGDPYAQAMHIFGIIEDSLEQADASMSDVVRTRVFLTDIDDWQAVGQAHSETFDEVRPATSILGVNELLASEILVEIEVNAVVTDD